MASNLVRAHAHTHTPSLSLSLSRTHTHSYAHTRMHAQNPGDLQAQQSKFICDFHIISY